MDSADGGVLGWLCRTLLMAPCNLFARTLLTAKVFLLLSVFSIIVKKQLDICGTAAEWMHGLVNDGLMCSCRWADGLIRWIYVFLKRG